MNYAYATLMLSRSGEEINERNLTAVLEASGTAVEASRVKAIVAALEDVDVEAVVSAEADVAPIDRAGDRSEESPDDRSEGPPDDRSEVSPDDRSSSVRGGEDADAPPADGDAEASGIRSKEER